METVNLNKQKKHRSLILMKYRSVTTGDLYPILELKSFECDKGRNASLLGADYMGELSRLSELTRFAELTRFLLLFPIISTLRLHGKRVVPLRRDPG